MTSCGGHPITCVGDRSLPCRRHRRHASSLLNREHVAVPKDGIPRAEHRAVVGTGDRAAGGHLDALDHGTHSPAPERGRPWRIRKRRFRQKLANLLGPAANVVRMSNRSGSLGVKSTAHRSRAAFLSSLTTAFPATFANVSGAYASAFLPCTAFHPPAGPKLTLRSSSIARSSRIPELPAGTPQP